MQATVLGLQEHLTAESQQSYLQKAHCAFSNSLAGRHTLPQRQR